MPGVGRFLADVLGMVKERTGAVVSLTELESCVIRPGSVLTGLTERTFPFPRFFQPV